MSAAETEIKPLAVEVDRSEQEEHPKYTWTRSLPLEQRHEGGVDPSVLRAVHDYDSTLILRWDPKVKLVAIFQRTQPTADPVLICHDEQGAGRVDLTILERLQQWDMRQWGNSFRTLLAAMEQAKRARSAEEKRALWESIDHSHAYRCHQHLMRQWDGNPRGLRSAVPDDIGLAVKTLDFGLRSLEAEVSR